MTTPITFPKQVYHLANLGYRLLTNLQPNSAQSHQHLGEVLIKQQRWDQAVAACQTAAALAPQNAWVHHSLSKALLGQGTDAAAIAAAERALELDPEVAWFHYQLGECWLKQENWEAAIPAFRRFLAKKPDFFWGYYHLGEALLETGQIEAAIAHYQTGLAQFPNDPSLQANLNYALTIQQQGQIDIACLLQRQPKLHRSFGKTVTLGVSSELLHFLNQHVDSSSHTLETGAGISTILFALKQTFHTCVVPDAELVDRIKNYCQINQISTEKISFQIGCSEVVLPQLQPAPLDLVLIDGRHAFPSPFIDWYYTANHLKVGGIVIVDDTKIWTGEVLQNFLKDEAEWQLKDEFPAASPNATAFVKLQPGSHDKWWAQQPYVMKYSASAALTQPV